MRRRWAPPPSTPLRLSPPPFPSPGPVAACGAGAEGAGRAAGLLALPSLCVEALPHARNVLPHALFPSRLPSAPPSPSPGSGPSSNAALSGARPESGRRGGRRRMKCPPSSGRRLAHWGPPRREAGHPRMALPAAPDRAPARRLGRPAGFPVAVHGFFFVCLLNESRRPLLLSVSDRSAGLSVRGTRAGF